MNSSASTMPDSFGSQPAAPLAPTRPFYWSVRRELWEYRSIYLAPLAAAGVALFGFLFVVHRVPEEVRELMSGKIFMDPQAAPDVRQPYDLVAALIMGAAFLVSIFYSLDALYGERRDRSILFWKSLPLSDLTTVLAKATVPLLILPLISFAITAVTTFLMFLISGAVVGAHGLSVGYLWSQLQGPTVLFLLLYHLLTIHILWYAPLYAWLLLVSAWARRAPLLWAVLPAFLIGAFERIAFHSSYFLNFLQERVAGGNDTMTSMQTDWPVHPDMHLTPLSFLRMPGLWGGLIAAAVFLYAAARMRRYRMPN
jgi:ABC-2 type transport system permease protein